MKTPTCPTCSEPVSEVNQLPNGTQLLPCGHTVTGDEYKSWRNKTVEHVPEDVAAREAVDQSVVSQEGQLQALLRYCRVNAENSLLFTDKGEGKKEAYDDVATRLRSILEA